MLLKPDVFPSSLHIYLKLLPGLSFSHVTPELSALSVYIWWSSSMDMYGGILSPLVYVYFFVSHGKVFQLTYNLNSLITDVQ